MQFKTDADQNSGILFGDVDDDVECAIEYEPANKALTLSTGNNAEAMRIDSSGNVGIGTSAPTLDLDVSGTASVMALPGTSGTTPQGFLRLGYYDRTWTGNEILMGIINASANDYAGYLQCKKPTDYSVNRSFAINPQGGNVGIGTASPSSGFHLSGANNTAAKVTLTNTANSNEWSIHPNYNTGDLIFADGGTEEFRMLAGGGLTFNGDTAAANALDDYEEGTWTPTSGVGLTIQYASYTKIGRLVFVSADVTIASSSSGSTFYMSLPFASNVTNYGGGTISFHTNSSYTDMSLNLESSVYFRATNKLSNLSYANVSGVRVIFNAVYQSN
tara:strand:+ start:170 stop:1162 length:993 start_codon:yes stop_codon:yes gene_type:complete